jgi:iron complex outermembrane receptor protein
MSRRVRSIVDTSVSPVAAAVARALPSSRTSATAWSRISLVGLGAILLPAFAGAQDAGGAAGDPQQAAKSEPTEVETVVVSARRKALETATERKKTAESIVDSVVADEAGMLPDNSVTEVLQRVSGVTISRFNDADHFSTEGNGIQVRGMSGVAARLNGREIFSANGGNGLSWGDVTPELMAAVDIYKSPTADQIEGGLGGQIDLRTKMPFDYEGGLQLNGSMEANYGDMADAINPSASALISNRWDTGIGEIGVLLDLSYSQLTQDSNFIRMEPYYRTSLPDGAGGYMDRFIPGGFDYGFDEYERVREGAYAALQWKPTENLSISQTVFYSRHETTGNGMGVFATAKQGSWGYGDWGNGPMYHGGAADGGADGLAVDPAVSTFDRNGLLLTTPAVFVRDPNTWAPAGIIQTGGNSSYNNGESWTGEASTNFEWTPIDKLMIKASAQFVRSEVDSRGYDVFPAMNLPGSFSLDLTGDLPEVTFNSQPTLADPVNTRWNAHMPNRQFNKGDMDAFNLDAEYSISDEGFFRSVRAGVRHADRSENDNGYYGWTNLCAGWDGCAISGPNANRSFDLAQSGDVQFQTFPDFFRGDANLPAGIWMPSLNLVNNLDPTAVDALYSGPATPDANTQAHNRFEFIPTDSRKQEIVNKSAYVVMRFAAFDGGALPIDGNIGVRVVRIENTSSGYYDQRGMFVNIGRVDANGNPVLDANGNQITDRVNLAGIPNVFDGSLTRMDGTTFTRGLPSINLRFKPSDSVQIRLAYGVTMDQAQFNDLRATGSIGLNVNNNQLDPTNPFKSDTGNPLLKPAISRNSDISLEWYQGPTSAHLSLFHKAITDALVYSTDVKDVPVYLNDGGTTTIQATRSEVNNSTKSSTIKGIEFGGRTFFDRLPEPWNGFGVEANYTYIDSKSPGDLYFDIDGGKHSDAPVRGLSKNTYNLQLMFEKPKFGARLAWNWRSAYLLSTNTNGTNGDYNYFATPNLGPTDSVNAVFRDISLPTFSDKYGQLDFGASYRPTENLSVSIDFRNLLDEISKTYTTGYSNGKTNKYHEKAPRSWFVSDRRATLGVRYKF